MGVCTLGRKKFYTADRDSTESDDVLLSEVLEHLKKPETFLIQGHGFKFLESLGFSMLSQFDKHPEFGDCITRTHNLVKFKKFTVLHYDNMKLTYDVIFCQKKDGVVTELYFKKIDFVYHDDYRDGFFQLILKGSYDFNSKRFLELKQPSITAFDDNYNMILSAKFNKEKDIWFFNKTNNDDIILKNYESKQFFDILNVEYEHSKKIKEINFRVLRKDNEMIVISLNDIVNTFTEFSHLKVSDFLNWPKFLTKDHIDIIDMMYI